MKMLGKLVLLLEALDEVATSETKEVTRIIRDLLVKLMGNDGAGWLVEFKKFLRKEPCWVKVFKTWRVLKLGTGLKIADDFRKALKNADCHIGDWGNDILGKPAFKAAEVETEVELVVVSNAELGFENGATVSQTYARAKELGLELCPNEVGPQLRLQYKDQPKGEWLLVAMEPITDSDGILNVFSVERGGDGEQWLGGGNGHPGYRWSADARWVFLRRK